MHYALLFYVTPEEWALRADPKEREAFWGSFGPYLKAIHEAGIWVSGAGLQSPDTATSVRLRGGERLVQDGPFADSKEQLGGFIVIDVPDLDAALAWAARFPAGPGGGVEVRPQLPALQPVI
jgi:hypothetical protein